MLAISLVTLGNPEQLTGGYLYHRRMADAASGHDARIRFVSFPSAPFPLPVACGGRVLRRAASGADVVLLDSIATAFAGPWLARGRTGVPLAVIAHQPPGGIDHGRLRTRLQAALDRLAYRPVAHVVAASQALAGDLVATGVPAERITVVAPGRDVAPERPAVGTTADLRRGRRVAILCVGNWVERKGILPLLDAFAELPPDAATLHLVGRDDADPAYAARVRARLQRPDLSGRIVVHGPVSKERVAELYRGADVFALASTREPYGTVYGEAMAEGLPVVGWRAGNLPHLAAHGREGLLVEPGDVAGLADALRRLAGDDGYRAALGSAARERAGSFPTWAESAGLLFSILRQVAAGR